MRSRTKTDGSNFFSAGPPADPTYELCLNEPLCESVKERIEEMWARYEPYCPDANFRSDARRHFVERMWELRLACVLLDHGFSLMRPPPKGPDICIKASPRIWVEAKAAGAGEGPDRVRNRAERAFTAAERGYTDEELPGVDWHGRPPSEESVILRCTQALDDKRSAYEEYRRAGIIAEGEPYIVAMSLAGIDQSHFVCHFDEGVPIFLKALFGIGSERILLSQSEEERARLYRPPRPHVNKASGAEIAAQAFASSTHPEISGVFGTCAGIENAPVDPGGEIMFVNNPRARWSIPPGTFRFGMEFVASERSATSSGSIERRDHRRRYAREEPPVGIADD